MHSDLPRIAAPVSPWAGDGTGGRMSAESGATIALVAIVGLALAACLPTWLGTVDADPGDA
jgi:hypothetical protein